MKTTAVFYDNLFAMIKRAFFAGLDSNGRAQWVNITPGEESVTLREYLDDLGDEGMEFRLLCLEGDAASSREVAKLLGCVLKSPFYDIDVCLKEAINQLIRLGVYWDERPLNLDIRVASNKGTRRAGKYSLLVYDESDSPDSLMDIDNFNDVDMVYHWLDAYLKALEEQAGIHIASKKIVEEV